jgi:molybdopterin-guanine dinucleotide biosynthesis protein A
MSRGALIHKAGKKDIAGFVLAGGKSSRMGQDKALLALNGQPLLQRAAYLVRAATGADAVVVGAKREGFADCAFVSDDWPDAGPLGGIATALRVTDAEWNLIVACDMPYLTRAWLEFLIGRAQASAADVVLVENNGRLEPLCAMYHRRSEAALRAALGRGMRKVTEVLRSLQLDTIQPAEWQAFDASGCLFKNVNSPADYEEAKRRLG